MTKGASRRKYKRELIVKEAKKYLYSKNTATTNELTEFMMTRFNKKYTVSTRGVSMILGSTQENGTKVFIKKGFTRNKGTIWELNKQA